MKTITGTWNYPDGTPVASGVLYLKLSQDAVVSGTAQIAPRVLAITLNASGQIPANTQIFANDELSPTGTFYKCSVVATGGVLVWGEDDFSITGASPINMNSLVPVVSAGSPVYSQLNQITLQTNGVNNGSQTKLNLKNGTSITITDDGVGGITIASSASTTVFSPLKRYLLSTWNETNNQFWGAATLTGPSFGTLLNSNVQGTATTPPGIQRGTTPSGTASSYVISYLSAAYAVGKSLHGIAWAKPFDTTTVNSSGFKMVPIVLFDQTGVNSTNYFNTNGNDATVLGNQIGFFGLTNGGTANWKAFCTAAGVQTVVDTGIPISTTGHTFEFQENPGVNVVFKIDGNTVATITTNIPASGTLMYLYGAGIQFPGALPASQPTALYSWMFLEATF